MPCADTIAGIATAAPIAPLAKGFAFITLHTPFKAAPKPLVFDVTDDATSVRSDAASATSVIPSAVLADSLVTPDNPSTKTPIFKLSFNFPILFNDSAALSTSPILDTAFFNFSESVPALSIFPIFFSDFSLQ